ncbi:hypothetical protein [Lachnoclostridium sp. Marseille-P6806]|uniref:hypothetical protein n=1 Tax=Lachnoclostridium sp. Marseille-P6806 TaxID=2364793 RepID=UPI002ED5D299
MAKQDKANNRLCSYLSPAPHALPQAAGFSSGLSPAPQAEPQAAGFSSGLSPAPHAEPQAAGFSEAPQAAGLSDAPQALPAVFSFHPAIFDNAISLYLLHENRFSRHYCRPVIIIIFTHESPASTHFFITQVTFL